MATSRDVAEAASVSQATVSRVLSGSTIVSPATRQRVEEAMERVGYVPHSGARSMKTGRAGAVGVVVADLTNPFYPHLLEALARQLERQGLATTVWLSADRGGDAAVRAIHERSIDGVVFTTVKPSSVELAHALEQERAVVLVNRTVKGLKCDQVSSDNDSGGGAVAEYVLGAGRRRLGFIGGDPEASTTQDRLAGFLRVLRSGPTSAPSVMFGEYNQRSGYENAARLLADGVDTLFCSNDLLAFGALHAAQRLGLRVPQDVWVVGYDDVPMADWSDPGLTTVRQDVDSMAAEAVALIVSRIEDRSRPARQRLFRPELVIRQSTGGLPSVRVTASDRACRQSAD